MEVRLTSNEERPPTFSSRPLHVVLDLAVADVDRAIGEGGDVRLVRDEHDGVAGFVQPLEERP